MARAFLLAFLFTAVTVVPSGARRAPHPIEDACSAGLWTVDSGNSGIDAVLIGRDGVSIGSSCPPGPGRLRAVKAGTKLNATLPRCPGVRGAMRINGVLEQGCDILSASIRPRRGGRARSLVAHRQWCGDGRLEPEKHESCDGQDLGGATCQGVPGFVGGTISCSTMCQLDTLGCVPIHQAKCGNGVRDAGEDCDGTAPDVTCEALGYVGGTVSCTADCRLDLRGCLIRPPATCGNGRRDPGESCDGDDLGGAICPH